MHQQKTCVSYVLDRFGMVKCGLASTKLFNTNVFRNVFARMWIFTGFGANIQSNSCAQ